MFGFGFGYDGAGRWFSILLAYLGGLVFEIFYGQDRL